MRINSLQCVGQAFQGVRVCRTSIIGYPKASGRNLTQASRRMQKKLEGLFKKEKSLPSSHLKSNMTPSVQMSHDPGILNSRSEFESGIRVLDRGINC